MATKLVPLPETQRLSSRVIRILGGNPGKFTLQGTNTYLVGNGAQRILIDTGEGKASWIKAIEEVLKKERAHCYAVVTHRHMDHIGGISDLHKLDSRTTVYKYDPDEKQKPIVDGQVFQVEGATLRAIHTPGHTSDHVTLVLEEEDAMFTGDNVLGQGTAVFEDLGLYLQSLEKMRHLFSGRAYPGHGPVIEHGKERIIEYIQHRKQREDQVLEVLASTQASETGAPETSRGEWDPMDVVKVIYKDVPENLHFAAHGGVMQILGKLQQEDKVVENPSTNKWRISTRATL